MATGFLRVGMPPKAASSASVEDITLAIGSLSLTYTRRSSSSSGEDTAAASSAAPEASPPERPKKKEKSYSVYAVTSCKQQEALVGVHSCKWSDLEAKLPGGSLFKSGARVKGFHTLAEAVTFFELQKNGLKPTLF